LERQLKGLQGIDTGAKGMRDADKFAKRYHGTLRKIKELANRRDHLADNIKKASDKLKDLVKQQKDYAASVRDSAKSYASLTSIEAPATGPQTAASLVQGLKDRLKALNDFRAGISKLTKMGLNKGSIDQLVQAGVEGGGADVQALVAGGKGTIKQVNKLQGQINTSATKLGKSTSKTMYGAGIQAQQGLVNGLIDDKKRLEKSAHKLASRLTNSVKKELGIHSPSKVFKDIGANTTEGMRQGLDPNIMAKRSRDVVTAMKTPVQNALDWYKDTFGNPNKGFRSVLSKFVAASSSILGALPSKIKTPITKLLGYLNTGLIGTKASTGLNFLLGKLGAATMHWIPDPKFKDGGIAFKNRYTPGRDIGTVQVSGYESIMRPEFTRAAGESWVNEANRAARMGGVAGARRFLSGSWGAFASGGVVKPTRTGRQNSSYPGHSGIDFYGVDGDPIYAVSNGRITYEGTGRGYGNAIFMVSDSGVPMVYGHTSAYIARQGQNVRAGQLIGRIGHSGNVRPPGPAGAHLHFEIAPSGFAKSGNRALTENYLSGGGIVSKIIGGISSALDFLKGLSPFKWLMNKATGLVGKIGNIGTGALVDGMKKVPAKILEAGKSWITDHLKDNNATDTWAGGSVSSLSKEQLNNAATIIRVAKQLGFGKRGAEIGLMTALQESTLRNLSGGDRDSVGAFQQRAPWGSFAARHNVASAARMFFLGGAGGQPGLKAYDWQHMGLDAVAQAVQVSGTPGAYAKWRDLAEKLVTRGYRNGTMDAAPGLAWVHRNELVNFRGGEQVYNQAMMRASQPRPAGPQHMKLVSGQLELVGSKAFIRNGVIDVIHEGALSD
jgi:murein DD-endopeptidase MepM/ murein hydrolase activator NlpD